MSTCAPPSKNARAPVSLHIERLTLDGFDLSPAQSAQMQHALERELARLSADTRGAVWQGEAVAAMVAPPLRLTGTPRPAQLGREVARSLFAAFGKRA